MKKATIAMKLEPETGLLMLVKKNDNKNILTQMHNANKDILLTVS